MDREQHPYFFYIFSDIYLRKQIMYSNMIVKINEISDDIDNVPFRAIIYMPDTFLVFIMQIVFCVYHADRVF